LLRVTSASDGLGGGAGCSEGEREGIVQACDEGSTGFSLEGLLTKDSEHVHTVLGLKIAKFGFPAMLTQRYMTVLLNGKEISRLHSVTSTIEEHCQPYILEFSALRYNLG